MNEVKYKLIKTYGKTCMMGGIVNKKNMIIYHHMDKKEHGGKYTLENGVLLSNDMHVILHIFEMKLPFLVEKLNENSRMYKKTRDKKYILENLHIAKYGLEYIKRDLSKNQVKMLQKYL